MGSPPAWNVLLVEDNPGDVSLIRMCAEKFPGVVVHHVPNAVQAHRFLFRQHPFEDAPRPDLVLLDLRMPIFDGTTVLESLRDSPRFDPGQVVVFTSSSLFTDRIQCQELGVTSYVTKPTDWGTWQPTIHRILSQHLKGFPAVPPEGGEAAPPVNRPPPPRPQ